MRQLYFTVLGPLPDGFGIIGIYSTHTAAWEVVKGTNDHFIGEMLTQEEAEQRGLITLAAVEGDPLKRRAA